MEIYNKSQITLVGGDTLCYSWFEYYLEIRVNRSALVFFFLFFFWGGGGGWGVGDLHARNYDKIENMYRLLICMLHIDICCYKYISSTNNHFKCSFVRVDAICPC